VTATSCPGPPRRSSCGARRPVRPEGAPDRGWR
jgi:hypothetical protein